MKILKIKTELYICGINEKNLVVQSGGSLQKKPGLFFYLFPEGNMREKRLGFFLTGSVPIKRLKMQKSKDECK